MGVKQHRPGCGGPNGRPWACSCPTAVSSWSEAQHAAAGAASAELHRLLAELLPVLDAAHTAGLWVPPPAAAAVKTLHSLAIGWGHNAQGKPTPPEHRAQLGLS